MKRKLGTYSMGNESYLESKSKYWYLMNLGEMSNTKLVTNKLKYVNLQMKKSLAKIKN